MKAGFILQMMVTSHPRSNIYSTCVMMKGSIVISTVVSEHRLFLYSFISFCKYLIDNLSDLTVTSSDDEHAISAVRTAELHCPSTWTSITDAQVTAANAKGWRIFINDTEKVVTK